MKIHIFYHTGCPKCNVLIGRLKKLISQEGYQAFTLVFHDTEAADMQERENAWVEFSLLGELNPNNAPAFFISNDDGEYLPALSHGGDPADGIKYLGRKTDYSDRHKGLIRPEEIESVLKTALDLEEKLWPKQKLLLPAHQSC